MTIQEAIKSGKPFRRRNEEWRLPINGKYWKDTPIKAVLNVTAEDLLADDWVVKSEPIVFECTWQTFITDHDTYVVACSETHKVGPLEGKRTRVTIEVLE